MDILLKTKEYIKQNQLFARGEKIIVGVSGGPDSVALIHILYKIQYELGLGLHVAHFNHHLRKNSLRDQKFVKNLALKLNLAYSIGEWKKKGAAQKGSIEDLARQERINFFIHLAKKEKAQAIALGHTQNDLAETVLMKAIRGAGLQGLRAILPKREMGGINFIRPLLNINRREIENYLKQQKLKYCLDETNLKTIFFRNKIRLELIPFLKKNYNPNIVETLANLANTIATDYDYIHAEALKAFKKSSRYSHQNFKILIALKSLTKSPLAIQRMTIRLAIEKLQGDTNRIELSHLLEIEDFINNPKSFGLIALPKNISLKKEGPNLAIEIRKA